MRGERALARTVEERGIVFLFVIQHARSGAERFAASCGGGRAIQPELSLAALPAAHTQQASCPCKFALELQVAARATAKQTSCDSSAEANSAGGSDDARKYGQVDVSTGDDCNTVATAAAAAERGGNRGGAGSFAHEVAFECQGAHCVTDLIETDDDDGVDEVLQQRPHLLQNAAATDAVDEGRLAFNADGSARRARFRQRRRGLNLTRDDPWARAECAEGEGDATQ